MFDSKYSVATAIHGGGRIMQVELMNEEDWVRVRLSVRWLDLGCLPTVQQSEAHVRSGKGRCK